MLLTLQLDSTDQTQSHSGWHHTPLAAPAHFPNTLTHTSSSSDLSYVHTRSKADEAVLFGDDRVAQRSPLFRGGKL